MISLGHAPQGQSSTPSLTEFNPYDVPYQGRVVEDVRVHFHYEPGIPLELLLSGSVGSAKSILMAHLALTHCLTYPRARHALCRKAMPDLKETILNKVLEHMEGDLVEGEDYEHNEQKGKIEFCNGSEIVSKSWADKRFKRFRSVELSSASVEELTENDDAFWPFYSELRQRVCRLPHVPENYIVCATNPDAPDHPAYTYFIEPNLAGKHHSTRHVYYSVTTDNKFLPPGYVKGLLESLDPKMAQRMVFGQWIEIMGEVVYHSYEKAENFRDRAYVISTAHPIRVCFDFNIGEGKPMSACAMQYISERDEFHFFAEFIVEGARTEDILEEMHGRGLFDHPVKYVIHGDQTGASRDTRSRGSDYDIIRKFLANTKSKSGRTIDFETYVPMKNPPVRKRHNTVNAYLKNALAKRRTFLYSSCNGIDRPKAQDRGDGCVLLDKGFRLVKLKPGGSYIEDDSKDYQHVTTAAGYGICSGLNHSKQQSQGTQEL